MVNSTVKSRVVGHRHLWVLLAELDYHGVTRREDLVAAVVVATYVDEASRDRLDYLHWLGGEPSVSRLDVAVYAIRREVAKVVYSVFWRSAHALLEQSLVMLFNGLERPLL